MSLHIGYDETPDAICGGNAARLTGDPHDPNVSCHRCLQIRQIFSTPTPAAHSAASGPVAVSPEPPSLGSRACMIYRHTRRLPDGCVDCGLSTIACAASRDLNQRACCTSCDHGA